MSRLVWAGGTNQNVGLAERIERRTVDENESGTSTPVTEKAGLDIVMGDWVLDESVRLQEDHGCQASKL